MSRHSVRVRRAVVAVLLAVPATALAAAPARVVHAATLPLTLIAETYNTPAEANLDLTVSLPASITPPIDGFTVRVTVHDEVREREQVGAALRGELGERLDSVTFDPPEVLRPAPEQIRMLVQLTAGGRTRDSLTVTDAGLYPLHVEFLEGDVVAAELVTFVHRLPDDDEPAEERMPVAAVVSTVTPVTLDDDAATVMDQPTRDELARLADLLEQSAVPITVRIPPAVLTKLAEGTEADQALLRRVHDAMVPHDVLSATVLPLDVSQAAQAAQQQLYTQWLRDGEDAVEGVLDNATDRTLTIIDRVLSQPGGLLLRDLGARMLVVPRSVYDQLPNSLGAFTDSTQLVQLEVSPGVTVDAAIPDQQMSKALTQDTDQPLANAIQLVSELLAARAQVLDHGGDPTRHSVLLATPDISLPAASGFGAFTALLAATPGLAAVDLDTLSTQTDELLSAEGPVVVGLPETVDGSLDSRLRTASSLGLEALSSGSMLPADDPRGGGWQRLIGALPTTALSDAQVTTIATGLRAQFRALRESVGVPAGFSFNLTGTTGSVPVTLRNDADIPLIVRVRMSSSKLEFPDGDQTVTLAPNAFTEIRVAIETRSRGDSPVTLEVFTPLGDTRIAPPVALTASINALSGIGNLVTGAALLVLLTWWVRHFRRSRRRRDATVAARRHPATNSSNGTPEPGDDIPGHDPQGHDPDDDGAPDPTPQALPTIDDALSPDAATSTLPPP